MGKLSSDDKRIRGRKGQSLRSRRMARSNWLCTDCLNSRPRVIRQADVVDHIVPLALGGDDVDDNTRNLCHDHHAVRTAEQFGHKAPKRETGEDGWPA